MGKLIRIFQGEFDPLEKQELSFRPSPEYGKAVGLLFSNDSSVSLSFASNMELQTNEIEFAYRNESLITPPSKRPISINTDLNTCTIVSGTVMNLKKTHEAKKKRTINVYLLVE